MTDERLKEIEERANAATVGPWVNLSDPECTCVIASEMPKIDDRHFGVALIPHCEGWKSVDWNIKDRNGDFIAAARTDIPALLYEVKRLRARYDEAEAEAQGANEAKSLAEYWTGVRTEERDSARAYASRLEARLRAVEVAARELCEAMSGKAYMLDVQTRYCRGCMKLEAEPHKDDCLVAALRAALEGEGGEKK